MACRIFKLWHMESISLTRDGTGALCVESVEAQPLDSQEVPTLFSYVYYTYKIVSCNNQHYFIYLKKELANV